MNKNQKRITNADQFLSAIKTFDPARQAIAVMSYASKENQRIRQKCFQGDTAYDLQHAVNEDADLNRSLCYLTKLLKRHDSRCIVPQKKSFCSLSKTYISPLEHAANIAKKDPELGALLITRLEQQVERLSLKNTHAEMFIKKTPTVYKPQKKQLSHVQPVLEFSENTDDINPPEAIHVVDIDKMYSGLDEKPSFMHH